MKTPAVSIVMCTYNGEEFIDQQVESILRQDFTDYELIICDDRSTDGTYDKLLAWAGRSDAIQVYRNEVNLGYNGNFAQAFTRARAPLISVADQDDIWMPEKTRLLYEAMQPPDVALAHSMSIRLEGRHLNHRKRKLQHHYSGNDPRKLMLFNPVMGHDMMFRTELLKKVLPVPERMFYDWWIAIIASTTGSIVSVPGAVVYHRIHANNCFFRKSTDLRRKELDLDEVWENFLTIPDLTEEQRLFLERSLRLIRPQVRPNASFSAALFAHFFMNRKIFFGHKKRAIPIFSHLKNSYKYASLNYRNIGTP